MTQYTTQMDAARQGIITPQMEIVAEKEHFDVEELRELIAKGQVIIPCNKNHKSISPSGVGAKLTTKINVNLGVSRDWKDVDMEYEKVHSAVEMGAEAIMDLSSYGDTRSFRRKLTSECPAMIGTVPIYDAVVYYHKALGKITSEEWIDIVRMHAEDGVDFMTIHCGMNRATAARFKQNKRLMNIVSRGGSIMFAWMEMTGKENPFYEHFDEILDICRGSNTADILHQFHRFGKNTPVHFLKNIMFACIISQAVSVIDMSASIRNTFCQIIFQNKCTGDILYFPVNFHSIIPPIISVDTALHLLNSEWQLLPQVYLLCRLHHTIYP